MFVLRQVGANAFVKNLPHDYADENFVQGWENTSQALQFETEEDARSAIASDPDGDSLLVEEL